MDREMKSFSRDFEIRQALLPGNQNFVEQILLFFSNNQARVMDREMKIFSRDFEIRQALLPGNQNFVEQILLFSPTTKRG